MDWVDLHRPARMRSIYSALPEVRYGIFCRQRTLPRILEKLVHTPLVGLLYNLHGNRRAKIASTNLHNAISKVLWSRCQCLFRQDIAWIGLYCSHIFPSFQEKGIFFSFLAEWVIHSYFASYDLLAKRSRLGCIYNPEPTFFFVFPFLFTPSYVEPNHTVDLFSTSI